MLNFQDSKLHESVQRPAHFLSHLFWNQQGPLGEFSPKRQGSPLWISWILAPYHFTVLLAICVWFCFILTSCLAFLVALSKLSSLSILEADRKFHLFSPLQISPREHTTLKFSSALNISSKKWVYKIFKSLCEEVLMHFLLKTLPRQWAWWGSHSIVFISLEENHKKMKINIPHLLESDNSKHTNLGLQDWLSRELFSHKTAGMSFKHSAINNARRFSLGNWNYHALKKPTQLISRPFFLFWKYE